MSENTALRKSENRLGEQVQNTNQCLDRWIDLTTVGCYEIRILECLFYEKVITKSLIAAELKLLGQHADETLERLQKKGFINDEGVSFGVRIIRIYQLSESGRFLLHNSNLC